MRRAGWGRQGFAESLFFLVLELSVQRKGTNLFGGFVHVWGGRVFCV